MLNHVRESSQSERGDFETVQFQAPSFADVLNWKEWTKELGKEKSTAGAQNYPKFFVDTYSLVHDLSQALKTGQAAFPDRSLRKSSPPIQIASVRFVFSLPESAALSRTHRLLKDKRPGEWDDYFTPLSWKLSPRQIQAIDHAWDCLEGVEGTASPFNHPIFIDDENKPEVTLDEIFRHDHKKPLIRQSWPRFLRDGFNALLNKLDPSPR